MGCLRRLCRDELIQIDLHLGAAHPVVGTEEPLLEVTHPICGVLCIGAESLLASAKGGVGVPREPRRAAVDESAFVSMSVELFMWR